jgi:hypothetical protein
MSADFDDGGERDELGLEPPEEVEPAPQAESALGRFIPTEPKSQWCCNCGLHIARHTEQATYAALCPVDANKDPDAAVRVAQTCYCSGSPHPRSESCAGAWSPPFALASQIESVPIPPGPTFTLTQGQFDQLLPDPDAAVRATLREGAKKWREAWEDDTNETIDEFFLRMTTAVFYEGVSVGRDEAFKACEAIAVEEMCGSKRTLSERLTGQRIVEAIIARRGKAGT